MSTFLLLLSLWMQTPCSLTIHHPRGHWRVATKPEVPPFHRVVNPPHHIRFTR